MRITLFQSVSQLLQIRASAEESSPDKLFILRGKHIGCLLLVQMMQGEKGQARADAIDTSLQRLDLGPAHCKAELGESFRTVQQIVQAVGVNVSGMQVAQC